MDPLDFSHIRSLLTTTRFGRNLIIVPRVGSTNDVAKTLAAQGAPEGTVILTENQTAGRGRLGRRWVAPPRTCLLCSILFRPDLLPSQAQWMTMLCSLSAAAAIQEVSGLEVALKWPNDLVVLSQSADHQPSGWRKLAGLLTESGFIGDRLEFIVVGIGINVNVKPKVLPRLAPNATSILAETGRETNRAKLLVVMLEGIETRYNQVRAGESPHAEWSERLVTLGRRVDVSTAEGALTGLAEAVDENGALLLRTSSGTLYTLTAGDVTLAHSEETQDPGPDDEKR